MSVHVAEFYEPFDPTSSIPVAFSDVKQQSFVIPIISALTGLWLGALSGAVAGTGIFPIFGTIAGLVLGAVGGLIIGLVLGPLYAFTISRNNDSIHKCLRAVQRMGAFGSAVALVLGVAVASATGHAAVGLVALFALPALIPCAAWTGSYILRAVITKDQARRVKQHYYGFSVTFGLVIASSIAVPIIFWLLCAFAGVV